nr:hypothetical protein [Tanacetum cinerariifolium]
MSYDLFFYSSSDDEDEVNSELALFTEACSAAIEVSKPKMTRNQAERDRYSAHDRLVAAYFFAHPRYDETTFLCSDCSGRIGISALVNCTSATREMTYDTVPDALDEYLQMSAITARDNLLHFCNVVMELYGREYLRQPTYTDMEKLYAHREQELRIWHAFFDVSEMNNDVNVLRQSLIFNDLKIGKAPDVPFVANDVTYKR